MARIQCGGPLTPVRVGLEVSTACDVLVPPTPYATHNAATPCEEDHTLEIVTTEYGAALSTGNQWAIPSCNQLARVVVKGLKTAHVGSWLWSVDYGYFLITGFNPGADTLMVMNPCLAGTAAPGTVVPACSLFIVSPPPCAITDSTVAYLTSDFIVPAVGGCVTVQMTSTEDLQAGYDIVFGGTSQQFHIAQIISDTAVQICNAGFGGTVGGTVLWQNAAGDFAHAVIISNSSTVFEQRRSVALFAIDGTTTTQFAALSLPPSQIVTYVNPSDTKAAQIFYTLQAFVSGTVQNANSALLAYNMNLKQATNGSSLISVVNENTSKFTASDSAFAESREIVWDDVISIAPGQTFTLDAEVSLTFTGNGLAAFNVDFLTISAVGMVVIS